MEILNEYLVPIAVVGCLIVGWIVKHFIKDVDNKWIPTICAVLGAFISVWVNNWAITPETIIGGALSGLASTGLHQLFTQFINREASETK